MFTCFQHITKKNIIPDDSNYMFLHPETGAIIDIRTANNEDLILVILQQADKIDLYKTR